MLALLRFSMLAGSLALPALPARAQGPVAEARVLALPRAAVASPADVVSRALGARDIVLSEQGESRAGSGLVHVRLRQVIGGVPVLRGEHVVAMRADGTPFAVVLGDVADEGDPGAFVIGADEAARLADAALSGQAPAEAGVASISTEGVAPGWMSVALPTLPAPALVRAVIAPRGPRAAWRVELCDRADSEERSVIVVDARDGSILETGSLTSNAAARGRVYPQGFLHGSEMRDFVDADVVTDIASPEGWIETSTTIGNNASVWEDRIGDGTTTPGLTPAGTGDPLLFDFPVTRVPLDDLDAALTNVFWAVNDAHDRFWRLGFDEPAGALQVRNHGRGGIAGDYLRVFVQYRAGAAATGIRNASTSSTSSDGNYASLTFGLWDRSGEIRDGALDTSLVYHEYAHHAVVRLMGGDGTCDDGTQPSGLAEGWCDFFAASFTNDPVIGAWVSGNVDAGIRTAAINRSSYTYSNLCAINPFSTTCSSTENGEIWAGTLWDLRIEMQRAYGAEGVERCERLVVEGLRLTPCRPTYLEAAQGLLLADDALTGGIDRCLIWQVLANRGLGWGGFSSGPDDRYPIAAYALGPECSAAAAVAWDRPRYGDDADAHVQVSDALASGVARTLRVTSSSGDAEDVIVPAPGSGPGLVRVATVPLRPGAAIPGDGLVQVVEGDALTATCTDCRNAPSASATVSRALSVTVLSHQLSSESCHDDDSDPAVPDFTAELPSLLDAGETATVSVTLGNAEDFGLEDVRVRVTCDNPNVQVLPRAEIPVGAVRGRYLNPAGFTVTLRAVAAPSPAVSFGDTATLTFDVTARGVSGSTTLRMDLAGDYIAERSVRSWGGTETFEAGSPSASSWTHSPQGGQPGDQWGIQNCGNGGGRAMAYAGASCGTYLDTPAAAVLMSPPLFDFSNRVLVVHPLSLTWWNDADLGYAVSRANYCDSELVVAYLTDDPNRPNFARPRDDRSGTLQYWVQWPGLSVTRNTGGWVQQAPSGAISTSSISGMVPANVRLLWTFFTDVYNPNNDGGCLITDPEGVGGGYKLDDVTFTYDLARLVPAVNTTCTRTCVARTVTTVTPPGGARCAGEPITISAAASEIAGCAGVLEYRYSGPGGFDTGWISATSVTTNAVDGATWNANVRCSTDTSCSQQIGVADPTLDDVAVGRVLAGTLRVHREGDDVVLGWDGTRTPAAYAIFRADSALADAPGRRAGLADLAGAPPSDAIRAGSADALTWHDAGAALTPGLSAYRVFGRKPCAGTAMDR